ncbi:MAG: Universal stress protein [Candidatus Argoarchaeum ethanivorans]|uniref:Universal stress protein n=1 Tax=Candidatus Argoarchaeum ethanivorans TaxID=2608793 RepID=A0A811T990_9EURY|nr:MAG: Universal stress protein [Candidatus Argoarchaeum ethanivorans]
MTDRLYKKIIVATDGSKEAERAVKYAIELARNTEAKVYALYVVDTAIPTTSSMSVAWGNVHEFLREEGAEATKKIAETGVKAGVEVEKKLSEGHPAEEIIKFSEELPADLIVMGSIGKSGLDRFLLGSVSDKVTRISKIPVMVVRNY